VTDSQAPAPTDVRPALAGAIVDTLVHRIGKDAQAARPHDWLAATILTLRNEIIERWMESPRRRMPPGRSASIISASNS